MVPAVLYSHGKSMPIAMGNKEVTKILNTEGGEHALINLKLEGAKDKADRMALIKDYQVDPINGALIHLDLMEVAMNEKVRIPVGRAHHGQRHRREGRRHLPVRPAQLEIECLPNQIPDAIEVNIIGAQGERVAPCAGYQGARRRPHPDRCRRHGRHDPAADLR